MSGEAALGCFQGEMVVEGEGGGAGFKEGCSQSGTCLGEGGRREVFVAGHFRLSLFVHSLFQSRVSKSNPGRVREGRRGVVLG